MKFLVDVQLPRRIARWLTAEGHDAVHTLDLSKGNRTKDNEILAIAEHEQRIVITKDEDFVTSRRVSGRPRKLLRILIGNITNSDLETLFRPQIPAIVAAFVYADFVELTDTALIIRA